MSSAETPAVRPKPSLLSNPTLRSVVYQTTLCAVIALLAWAAISNAIDNLARARIATGFGFWHQAAGFDISQTLIDFSSSTSTYGRAFWVGLLNTLLVAGLGVVFATVLGFIVGISRLSKNWLLAKVATGYVETIRNIPLLLQLLFWYKAVIKTLPEMRDSIRIIGGTYLNNRGLFLPKPQFLSGFDVVGRNIPARLVSGDYYDFFPVGTDHTGIAIADVCGKGIPASLITAMCRSVLRSSARENLSPAAVLSAVNRNLFPDIREDMFITGIYAVAANDGSGLKLARAGHTTPYLWRKASGAVEEITAPGVAIGFDKGDVFERITKDVSVDMAPGDVLLLYTDGVNEATDHKGLLFDDARIKTSLATSAPNGAKAVVDHLCNAVDQFMAGHPLSDDLTLVAIAKK